MLTASQAQVPVANGAVQDEGRPAPGGGQPQGVEGEEGLVMPTASQALVPVANGAVQEEGRPATGGGQPEEVQGEGGLGGYARAAPAEPDDDPSGYRVILEQALNNAWASQQREFVGQITSFRQEMRSLMLELRTNQVAELERQSTSKTGECLFL